MALSTLAESVSRFSQYTMEHFQHLIAHLHTGHWVALGLGAISVLVWRHCSRPAGVPPGPTPLPLVGNMLQLSEAMHLDMMRLRERYGDIFSIYLGGNLLIVLNSQRLIKEAFVTSGTMFADRPDSAFYNDGGFFTAKFNEKFTADKKKCLMALRAAGYGTKEGEQRILDGTEDLIKFLQENQCDDGVDLTEVMTKYSVNVYLKILVGKQFEFDDPMLKELIKDAKAFFDMFSASALIVDLLPKVLVRLIFHKKLQALSDTAKHIGDKYMKPFFLEKRKRYEESDKTTFSDYYLKGEEKEQDDHWSEKKISEFFVLNLADSVTSVPLLTSWCLFCAMHFPEKQKNIQTEIDQIIGSRLPSMSHKSSMHYTQAFILECVRFSSLVNLSMVHKPLQDTTLAGYRIPKEAGIMGNFWAVNRDPQHWNEPEKFKPERHLDENGMFVQSDHVMIFGEGRRMCMGEQLVKAQNFLVFVRLLQCFTLRFPDNEPLPKLTPEKESFVRKPPPYKVCATPR